MIQIPIDKLLEFRETLGCPGVINISIDSQFRRILGTYSPIAACSLDRDGEGHLLMIHLFDICRLETVGPIIWHDDKPKHISFSSDGKYLKGLTRNIGIFEFINKHYSLSSTYDKWLLDFLTKKECLMPLHNLLSYGLSKDLDASYKLPLTAIKEQLLKDIKDLLFNYPLPSNSINVQE